MDRNHSSPNDILTNRKRTKDRATYLGTMDHSDNTTVRSAVGLLVGVGWVDGGGQCDWGFGMETPTAARTLRATGLQRINGQW